MSKINQESAQFEADSRKDTVAKNTIESYDVEDEDGFSNVFQNQNYLNQLCELMENISDKGATIAQLKDGTVFVSETRIVVYKYVWDKNKCMFIKQRTRNTRNTTKSKVEADISIEEEVE